MLWSCLRSYFLIFVCAYLRVTFLQKLAVTHLAFIKAISMIGQLLLKKIANNTIFATSVLLALML